MLDQPAIQLQEQLVALLAEHQQLLALIEKKLQALTKADHALIHECCLKENQHIQRIGEIEKARQALLGRITQMLAPRSAKPMSLVEIAGRLPEPARGKVLALRQNLRQLLESIGRRNQVARKATESLLHHVQGVISLVTQAVNGSTYGRRPAGGPGGERISSFSATA